MFKRLGAQDRTSFFLIRSVQEDVFLEMGPYIGKAGALLKRRVGFWQILPTATCSSRDNKHDNE